MSDPLTPDALHRALAYPYRIPATSFAFSPADGATRALTDFQITQARIVSQKRGVTTYDIDAIADGATLRLQNVCPVIAPARTPRPTSCTANITAAARRRSTPSCANSTISSRYFRRTLPATARSRPASGVRAAHAGTCSSICWAKRNSRACTKPKASASNSISCNWNSRKLVLTACRWRSISTITTSIHGPLLDAQGQPIVLSCFAVTQHGLQTANEEQVLTAALRELFPGKTRDRAIADIVQSTETRRAATAALKHLRLALDGAMPAAESKG